MIIYRVEKSQLKLTAYLNKSKSFLGRIKMKSLEQLLKDLKKTEGRLVNTTARNDINRYHIHTFRNLQEEVLWQKFRNPSQTQQEVK